ncbi:4'-phosphopantetheinyl transferase family protein [Mesonia maritima]|uniref:Phosphopantetheine--protein transferase-like protein n=1 Tax=Mesonia maritima TaxID=1793873 RepID=A0ABU1K972_9FLAO|nr:4'-phosphopantetheinyl transferase superfamily protein [Mesonia maritima]MDR6301602.1 phosphopantetheine--protein transferase-like protein [Mesonia maritima]
MIGNDVVNLSLAKQESNWQRPRFLQKIFTKREQQQINKSSEPEKLVWLFWSMKEAAYKASQRLQNSSPTFNPSQFECKIDVEKHNFFRGKVSYKNETFFSTSLIIENTIFSYCKKNNSVEIFHKIVEAEKLKSEIIKSFSRLKNLPEENISIQKNENQIPYFFYEKEMLSNSFSLSHHGKFAAFIIAS